MDISTPHSPSVLSQFLKPGGEAYGVTGNGTHLYVADLQQGVYLLNITDSRHPIELAHFSDVAPHDIFSDGNNIYLADQDRQLIIFEPNLTLVSVSGNSVPSFDIIGVIFVILCSKNCRKPKQE